MICMKSESSSERLGMGDHFVRLLALFKFRTLGFRHSTVFALSQLKTFQFNIELFANRP